MNVTRPSSLENQNSSRLAFPRWMVGLWKRETLKKLTLNYIPDTFFPTRRTFLDNHIDVFKLNENLFIEQEIISICERVIIHGSFYEQCATVNSNHTIVLFVNKMRKLSDIKCVILATTILDNAKINIPNCNRNKSISIDLPIKVKFVSDDCTYLTPESYGVAKRRFNDDEIIKKYYGVIYPFTKR
jgi:hypothetical protein